MKILGRIESFNESVRLLLKITACMQCSATLSSETTLHSMIALYGSELLAGCLELLIVAILGAGGVGRLYDVLALHSSLVFDLNVDWVY